MNGKDTQMFCIITEGDSPIETDWYFQGHPLSHNMGVTITKVGQRSSVLNIQHVTYGHSGNYTCVARNAAGNTSTSAELIVYGIKFI